MSPSKMFQLVALVGLLGVALATELTDDGRVFTKDQKDYKVPKFEMYGMELEDTAGFPGTSSLPLDHHGYNEVIENCDFEKDVVPFHTLGKYATVIYSPNSEAFGKFQSYDLIPENKDNYYPGTPYASAMNYKDGPKKFNQKDIMMRTCRISKKEVDGGAWHVQRLGPFISTGGYDWWQVGWNNAFMLQDVIDQHPEGIDLIKHILVAVDKNGKRLSFPPIHMHHIHVAPTNGVRPRLSTMPLCPNHLGLGIGFLDDIVAKYGRKGCFNSTNILEQHGDYVCQPEDDGIECMTQGDHLPRRVIERLDIEGEMNDVRPAGSEPMEWYFQIAVRWRPMDKSVPFVNLLSLLGNPRIVPDNQLQSAAVMPTPTDEASFTISRGQMINTGTLARGKVHSHASVFEASFLFAAEYEDVGLDGAKFVPQQSYMPQRITSELGFKDSNEFVHYMLDNLKASQDTWDSRCPGNAHAHKDPYSVCSRPRPELICGTKVDQAMVEFKGVEYPFDRRAKTWCKPWSFKVGDPILYGQINKKVIAPPAASNPGVIPPYIGNHLALFIYYYSDEHTYSFSNGIVLSHFGMVYDNVININPMEWVARVISVVLLEGFPNHPSSLLIYEYSFLLVVTLLLAAVVHVSRIVYANYIRPRLVTLVTGKVVVNHEYELVKLMDDEESGSKVAHVL